VHSLEAFSWDPHPPSPVPTAVGKQWARRHLGNEMLQHIPDHIPDEGTAGSGCWQSKRFFPSFKDKYWNTPWA
jgi:hypothetical protein